MTLYEQIRDFVALGFIIEFSPQPLNMNIKVVNHGIEKSSWLPYNDHCDEKTITRCIAFMIDEILMEVTQPRKSE